MMGVTLMTQKELSQLYWLRKEIMREQKRLEELEHAARGDVANIVGLSPIKGMEDIQHSYALFLTEERDLMKRKLEQLLTEYTSLDQYIASVNDSVMRQILGLRYRDGYSWVQVAARLGGGNTADGVRMMQKRFLRKE